MVFSPDSSSRTAPAPIMPSSPTRRRGICTSMVSASLPPLLYRGSVKDVYGGEGEIFFFSPSCPVFAVGAGGASGEVRGGGGGALASIADNMFRFLSKPA